MSRRLTKVVALVLAGVLLVSLAGLVGCGEDEEGEKKTEIAIGFQSDLTGPAAYAVRHLYDGFLDYFRMVEEEEPIPGVEIEVITYDTRSMASRVAPGYAWMKAKGVDVLCLVAGVDREQLADKIEQDQIPVIGTQAAKPLLGHQWMFSLMTYPETQAEAILLWIIDDWEGEGLPKVGHLGCAAFTITEHYQAGFDEFLAANPDKIDWAGVEKGPYMATVWAPEVDRLKDCDYIVLSTVGPSAASFVAEARARGYEGKLISGMEAFPGFWDLVKARVAPDELYDCYYAHFQPWWTETGTYNDVVKEHLLKYHSQSEAETYMRGTGYNAGWACAIYTADAIRRAVAAVGAENVDNFALRDALAQTDMTVVGMGNPWKFHEDYNCLCRTQKMFKWNIAEEDWDAVSDWILPPSADVE